MHAKNVVRDSELSLLHAKDKSVDVHWTKEVFDHRSCEKLDRGLERQCDRHPVRCTVAVRNHRRSLPKVQPFTENVAVGEKVGNVRFCVKKL